MPEMAAFCGRRFVVDRRAERICDTVHYSGQPNLPGTVLLADLRCDGSAHGGCQAECRFFWKEAWLRKVAPDAPGPGPLPAPRPRRAPRARPPRQVKHTVAVGRAAAGALAVPGHRAAQGLRSTCKLWDPRSYVREYTTGNVSLGRFLRVTARAAVQEPMRKLGLIPEVHLPGTRTGPRRRSPARPAAGRARAGQEQGGDRGHPDAGGTAPRPVVRPRDDAALRRHLPGAPADPALHRRARRPDDRAEERLRHPRRRGLLRRAQPARAGSARARSTPTGASAGCAGWSRRQRPALPSGARLGGAGRPGPRGRRRRRVPKHRPARVAAARARGPWRRRRTRATQSGMPTQGGTAGSARNSSTVSRRRAQGARDVQGDRRLERAPAQDDHGARRRPRTRSGRRRRRTPIPPLP